MKIISILAIVLLTTSNTYGQYDHVEPFYSGLAAVKLNGKWGFIDTNQNLVIPCIFGDEYEFNDNGGSWNQAKAPRFQGDFCNINLGWDNSHNVIDKLGRTQLPWCRLIIEIPPPNQLSVILRVDGKLGIIDNNLNVLSNAFYDEVFADFGFDLQEGSRNNMLLPEKLKNIRVKKQNYYGFILDRGKSVIPCIYDEASDFINGIAKVKMNGIVFYIDESGSKVK